MLASKIKLLFPDPLRNNSLRLKAFFSLAVLFILLTLASIGIVSFTVRSALDTYEKKQVEIKTNLAIETIRTDLSTLSEITKSRAWRDASANFLRGKYPSYPEMNITPTAFHEQAVDAFVFLKPDGCLFFSVMASSPKILVFPCSREILDFVSNHLPQKERSTFEGIVLIENQLYMAACQPILNSRGTGMVQGWLWGLRKCDQSYVSGLSNKLNLEISLLPWTEALPPQNWLEKIDEQRGRLLLETHSFLAVETQKKIIGIRLLDKRPDTIPVAVVAQEEWKLKESQRGITLILFFTQLIMAVIGFFLALDFLNRKILQPAEELTISVASQSPPELLQAITTGDEIQKMSRLVQDSLVFCQDNETFLQTMLNTLKVGIMLVSSKDDTLLRINQYGAAIIGLPPEQLIGQPYTRYICQDECESPFLTTNPHGGGGNSKCKLFSSDGTSRTVLTSVTPITHQGEELFLKTFLDISKLERTQSLLSESEQRYRTIFMNTGTAIFISRNNKTILQSNDEFVKLTGRKEKAEVEDHKWPEFFHPDDIKQMCEYHTLRRTNVSTAPRNYETRLQRLPGETRYVLITVSTIPNTDLTIASMVDISPQKETAKLLANIAFTDSLTGLANRTGIQFDLDKRLKKEYSQLAVFSLDIDGFKMINDSLGHKRGDEILQQVARRLTNFFVGTQNKVARMSGDEFVVVTPLQNGNQEATELASKILELFTRPVVAGEAEIFLNVSIGLSLAPDHSQDAEQLIIFADLAMYEAKLTGKNSFHVYSKQLSLAAEAQVKVEIDLRNALTQKGIQPFFQPIVSLPDCSIVGMEALARWHEQDGTILQPDIFIPAAERTGMITDIDLTILDQACFQLMKWNRQGLKNIYVSSNLSGRHFQRGTVVRDIRDIIDKHAIKPEQLRLELTETVYMQHQEQTRRQIKELLELGVKTSIDDFGTGYSSLSYLQDTPFRTLKIDRSFVWNLPASSAQTLLKMVIGLARAIGLTTLAEGIETKEQLKIVSDLGCKFGQGYLFSPPVPADKFQELLKQENLLPQ